MRLRELGLVPWWWILDESRDVTTWRYAASVYDYVVETVPLARIDCWRGHLPPLVICEARATRGVLERIAGDYLCPITATGGQSGGFIVNEIVPLLADNDRKVLYIGDCEERGPGDHIEANTRRYIEEHTGASSRPRRGLRSRSHLRRSRAHDGFRMMVRRDGAGVRLLTRNCLISCTQPGPEGGRWARDGRQGSMNPAGRAARVCTNMVETDRAPTPGSRIPHDWGSHLVRPPPEKRISGLPNRRRSTLLAFGSLHLASPSNETLTCRAQPTAMSFDLASAAAATGVAKSSVLRTIKAERISGQRDDNGRWHIEPVELFKIFPPLPPTQPATRDERHPSRPPRSIIAVQLCELRAGRYAAGPRPLDCRGRRLEASWRAIACCWWGRAGSWWASLPMPTPR